MLLFWLLSGPEGITAGDQVCISYGNWPAEPFLLLFGFVPQPNPHDCITLFSSLQHMAHCYLECCAAALQAAETAGSSSSSAQQGTAAAAAARQLLQSQRFRETYAQQVESIEDQLQQQQQREGGPGGFRDMIVNASGVDGRLATALSYIHQAVAAAAAAQQEGGSNRSSSSDTGALEAPEAAAAAAAVQQLQLPLGAVLQHRLQQVVEQLERSREQSSIGSIQLPGLQQEGDAAAADDDENSDCYTESAAHGELIKQYCSSQAALARQLAGRYSENAAS
jgi:hypothetical protein